MLVMSLPSHEPALPREPQRRRRGVIVWQPHYEGFATIAYRDGRAIAGISGPWSNQYVLIWWRPAQAIREVEVFDSLDEAKRAVARGEAGEVPRRLRDLIRAVCREPIAVPRPSWVARLHRWLRGTRRVSAPAGVRRVRRYDSEETDLRGLNFRALR